MKAVASWVVVGGLLVGVGVWCLTATAPHTQAQTQDTAGTVLHLHDPIDLAVLRNILIYPETAIYIQDALIESPCTGIALRWRPGASATDREYFFTMTFQEPGSPTDSLLTVLYAHDGSSGGEPSLPPDSCTYEYVQGLPRTELGEIVLSDLGAYDFLVHILTQERRTILRIARRWKITGLKIEESESSSGQPEYRVHLELSRGRNFRTVTLVSALGMGGEFGRLMMRRE